MSYYNCRAMLSGLVERLLYNPFATNINSACGFVKDEDVWFFDDRSSDGKALSLTSGESGTFIANPCIISLEQIKR